MNKTFHTNFEYADRRSKAKYVWLKYGSILKGRILDVGADECHLKQYIDEDTHYWGIGIGGNPDQVVNLEKECLPFEDESFDCVLCLDVLEHIDNLHEVFDELCRVTRRYVIISLPNCWAVFYNVLRYANEVPSQPLKYYGIPLEPPVDRHKWFFSTEDAEKFIRYRAAKNGVEVIQMDNYGNAILSETSRLRRWARSILLRKDLNPRNLYETPLWVVLEKGAHTTKS